MQERIFAYGRASCAYQSGAGAGYVRRHAGGGTKTGHSPRSGGSRQKRDKTAHAASWGPARVCSRCDECNASSVPRAENGLQRGSVGWWPAAVHSLERKGLREERRGQGGKKRGMREGGRVKNEGKEEEEEDGGEGGGGGEWQGLSGGGGGSEGTGGSWRRLGDGGGGRFSVGGSSGGG